MGLVEHLSPNRTPPRLHLNPDPHPRPRTNLNRNSICEFTIIFYPQNYPDPYAYLQT